MEIWLPVEKSSICKFEPACNKQEWQYSSELIRFWKSLSISELAV